MQSRRHTIAPGVVQEFVGCAKCGYAMSGTSTQTSARKIRYYKCIGSDSRRKLGGPVCDNNRFIRQELLDQTVWAEVVRLLEDPALIQQELDRRLAAARTSDPTRKREQSLQRELSQVDKGIERLLTAYQEELLWLEQLRGRMPMLRQRQQALRAELQAITDQANDCAAFLRLAETLTAFRSVPARLSDLRFARSVSIPLLGGLRSITPIFRRKGLHLLSGPAFLPLSAHESRLLLALSLYYCPSLLAPI
jgi:site-specific DNA recombinase